MLACSFCGKTQRQVAKLLSGLDTTHICNNCVELSYNILQKELKATPTTREQLGMTIKKQSPKQIVAYLDEHIIGQETAKKSASVAVYNHFKRLFRQPKVPVQKSNMLFIGPTGVGKTLIAQNLAELLDVPFVITDATTITESGYAGDDAEVLISKLFQAANYDLERAQVGIIYIDEIDKKAKRNDYVSLSRDVSGEGVQQSLLKLMEGCVVNTTSKRGSKQQQVAFDTKDVLFIVGGAFVGLDTSIMERVGKNRIGFGDQKITTSIGWEQHLETQDLIQYGLIPEFIGRLPSVNILHELSKEDLVKVLLEPKHSIVKQYQAMFELDDVELEFNEESISAIADKAIDQNIGARGLRRILEEMLLEIQFELPDMAKTGVKKIVITKDTINNGSNPKYVRGDVSE
jgi:ATP-dependent Clp protease ATP-binding subunit ClpX